MPVYSFGEFLKILEPLYVKKDPAHSVGHIKRIYQKACMFAKSKKIDRNLLSIAAVLHGVTDDKLPEAQRLLLDAGISAILLEKAVLVARESQANSIPETPEGKILHDAHLCEGGEDFIAAKAFVTSSFNNYPIRETYAWVSQNIINNNARQCYTPEGKRDYAKKLRRLKAIWSELGEILSIS